VWNGCVCLGIVSRCGWEDNIRMDVGDVTEGISTLT
jgi:hypothetical protein